MSYQKVLDEAIGEPPPSTVDVDGIVRRARRRARIHRLAAVAGAVLLVSSGVVVALGGPGIGERVPATGPPDQPAAEPIRSFPEYAEGTKLIAEASAPLSDGGVDLTFTPSVPQLDLTIFTRCDGAGAGVAAGAKLELRPGTVNLPGLCGESPTGSSPDDSGAGPSPEWATIHPSGGWATFATAGVASTITLRAGTADGPGAPSPDATLGLAVGEPVPFEEYPFPAPPTELPPLDADLGAALDPYDDAPRRELRADPGDPGHVQELTIEWPEEDLVVLLRAQTPGRLRLEVDGEPLGQVAVWDYRQEVSAWQLVQVEPEELARQPTPGQEVTLTVVPDQLAGDWVCAILLDPHRR
jgi:hypothetical protein